MSDPLFSCLVAPLQFLLRSTGAGGASYLCKLLTCLRVSSDLNLLVFTELQAFELQTMPPSPEQCAGPKENEAMPSS